MLLYLDDVRPAPEGWTLARTAEEAISLIRGGSVVMISFDHDLGTELTGYSVSKVIEEGAFRGTIAPMTWGVHSANSVGRADIVRAMNSAERFWYPS